MNRKQQENEDKIFSAIQDLKDSMFGMKQPYTRYCYIHSDEDGYVFSEEKAEVFLTLLCSFSPETRTYNPEWGAVMPLFFRVTLRLLAAICNSGDWIFVSFRKLAKTAMKYSPNEKSVYERIVDSHREQIDRAFPSGSFWADYESFCTFMGFIDPEAFYQCVKNTLERFLDDQHLNVLDRDQMTDSVVARISRLSAAIERDLKRAEPQTEDEQ